MLTIRGVKNRNRLPVDLIKSGKMQERFNQIEKTQLIDFCVRRGRARIAV